MTNQPAPHEYSEPSWFRAHPTYVGFAKGGHRRNDPDWSADKTEVHSSLCIRWDVETGDAVATGFPLSASSTREASDLALLLPSVGEAITTHRRIAQRSVNYPARAGLVQRPLGEANGGDPRPVVERAGERYGRPILGSTRIVPETESALKHGWFAPDADSALFGTAFVYAVHSLTDGVEENTPVEKTQWVLGQVGIARTHVLEADWNDEKSCRELFGHALDNDVETLNAMASLLVDPQAFAESRRAQDRKREIAFARDAWIRKSTRVKPRVCEKAIESAWRTFEKGLEAPLHQRGLGIFVTPHKLEDGDNLDSHDLINAAVECRVGSTSWYGGDAATEELTAEENDTLWRLIFRNAVSNDLGAVVRVVEDGKTRVFITRDAQKFFTHKAAFSITNKAGVSALIPGERDITVFSE